MMVDGAGNPTLHRVLQNPTLQDFHEGSDYRIVSREPGAVRRDIPIFAMSENLSLHAHNHSVRDSITNILQKVEEKCCLSVDDVPGAVFIRNVLTPLECDKLIKLTEAAGYDQDAPTRLGRHVRHNDNCVFIASEALNDAIFRRCRGSLPPTVEGGEIRGINRRWRFYKYRPGDIFRAHIDPGGWTGSGFDQSGRLIPDSFADRVSQMTFLLYLNDEFDGGATRFFIDPVRPRLGEAAQCRQTVCVSPEQGSVLCFFHGNHTLSPWHEGGELAAGTKYVLRTDVLYEFK